MPTDTLQSQESIARDYHSDTTYIGRDADGAAHYWCAYRRTIVVVDADAAGRDLFHLDETPCDGLLDWADHVDRKREWADGPRVVSGMDEAIDRAVTVR